MLSSLSSVPPVWPKPRPEIIGTKPPHAAMIGASIRLTLSPTPPVECLSRTGPGRFAPAQSSTSPECVIACVSATVSAPDKPFRNIAIAIAAACASLHEPSTRPPTNASICARSSAWPSRLRRMISCASTALLSRRISVRSGYGRRRRGAAAEHRLDVVQQAARADAKTLRGQRRGAEDLFDEAEVERRVRHGADAARGLEAD